VQLPELTGGTGVVGVAGAVGAVSEFIVGSFVLLLMFCELQNQLPATLSQSLRGRFGQLREYFARAAGNAFAIP
jgi:hypothetical protein